MAPNTVRSWLRRGENAPPPAMGRRPILKALLPWVRNRCQEGVRNSDVLRQELLELGQKVSLRTVERATAVMRRETRAMERATLRIETELAQVPYARPQLGLPEHGRPNVFSAAFSKVAI